MRANLRTLTGFALVYAGCGVIALGALFAWTGFTDLGFSLALVVAIALIPVTAILVTLGQRIARRTPTGESEVAAQPDAILRDPIDFTFATWNGIDSRGAVARLSRHLDAVGIPHRFERGGIDVAEPALRWHVGPVVGQLRIAGWVEGADADDRSMVAAAIAEFLTGELGIDLEPRAA